ncbi:MAG: hypothetical protein HYX54_09845 [Chloroflexi bacterium]|nr:hypothetical protein [Chloroflexota bacterium]
MTLPPTDTIGSPAQPSTETWRLMLILAAFLLGSALVLAPAKVTNRR